MSQKNCFIDDNLLNPIIEYSKSCSGFEIFYEQQTKDDERTNTGKVKIVGLYSTDDETDLVRFTTVIMGREFESKAIIEMNKALASQGGLVKLQLKMWEVLKNKKIIFLPQGDKGGIDLKTTDINELLKLYGTMAVSKKQKSDTHK